MKYFFGFKESCSNNPYLHIVCKPSSTLKVQLLHWNKYMFGFKKSLVLYMHNLLNVTVRLHLSH